MSPRVINMVTSTGTKVGEDVVEPVRRIIGEEGAGEEAKTEAFISRPTNTVQQEASRPTPDGEGGEAEEDGPVETDPSSPSKEKSLEARANDQDVGVEGN